MSCNAEFLEYETLRYQLRKWWVRLHRLHQSSPCPPPSLRWVLLAESLGHAGEGLMESGKYRTWLETRGVRNPSDADLDRFAKQTMGSPYGTLAELLLAAWVDSRGMFGGTRGLLRARGLWEPSEEDLRTWGRAIRRAIVRRGAAVLAAELAWFTFLALTGVWGILFSVFVPISILVCGLGVSAGTKLTGDDRLALQKAGKHGQYF